MQRSLKDLEHYSVAATDGHIGHVVDFLLDDEQWIVRYLVVEAGGHFNGRRVLISPMSFREVDWSTRQFHLAVTVEMVKSSPTVDADTPVSRAKTDSHLRSASDLRRYHVQGTDNAIGHIDDFITDDATWGVRFLVVDTSNWLFGRKVLVAPQWATRVSAQDRKVHVDMTREAIQNSPAWNGDAQVNRDYEQRLCNYYGRPLDWGNEGYPSEAEPPSR